jgi:phage FluMu protein Com
VNVDSNFLKEIEIKGVEGERVTVDIEYLWLHVKCKKCKTFGHFTHTCTKIEKHVWIPCKSDPVQKDLPT